MWRLLLSMRGEVRFYSEVSRKPSEVHGTGKQYFLMRMSLSFEHDDTSETVTAR